MEESKQVEQALRRFYPERENLLLLLKEIQKEVGYLSRETLEKVANFLGLPPSEIFGVVTFYNFFRRTPPGRNIIQVCLGTACYLQGGQLILDAFSRELQIKKGETTEDRNFSLDSAACFGCCNVAPVVKINSCIYPKMTPGKVEEVIIRLREKEETR